MGKPYLSKEEKHSVKLMFNCRPSDVAIIKSAATRSGYLTLSAFLRMTVLEKSRQSHEDH